MLFADAGDFEIDHVRQLYYTTPAKDLPNIVVLLNRGVIINARVLASSGNVLGKLEALNPHPEFRTEAAEGSGDMWCLIDPRTDELRAGANLGLLLTMLTGHLERCQLMPVPFAKYIQSILNGAGLIISPTHGTTWTMLEDGEPQA